MIVYCTGTKTGDEAYQILHKNIIDFIESLGHSVLSELSGKFSSTIPLTETQIYKRNLKWIDGSKLVIAEISDSELETGIEIAYALFHRKIPVLVGGKALGLARLMAAGFPVPPGICVTTESYRQSLLASGLTPTEEWKYVCTLSEEERKAALSAYQARIKEADTSSLIAEWQAALQQLDIPFPTSWAIRSSATNEDAGRTSFAGLYRTHLVVAVEQLDDAIKDLWTSLWQDRVIRYAVEHGGDPAVPSMAVVIQPMLDALVSGVAYSIHPVTGRSIYVAVDAVSCGRTYPASPCGRRTVVARRTSSSSTNPYAGLGAT